MWYILVFWVGALLGFLLHVWWHNKKIHVAGELIKTVEEDRILYSLELHEQIEELEAHDTITFKVVSSEELSDRN